MSKLVIVILGTVLLLAGASLARRYMDIREDRAEMSRLLALQPANAKLFSASMVSNLPEPAQRYFKYMIAEGTPLLTVAQIEMVGRFSLGTQEAPHYMAMRAKQVMAPPDGFVWVASVRSGHLWFSGSDSANWTRFWGWNVFPVARTRSDADHVQSAFGRAVAEAAFWTPAALLPRDDVIWNTQQADVASVTVKQGPWEQTVDIHLDQDGRPLDVRMMRWSNANPDGVYRHQPFGGTMSDFRTIQGFQLPMHVEAGNFFGSPSYFPFFIAEVTDISFPPPPTNR